MTPPPSAAAGSFAFPQFPELLALLERQVGLYQKLRALSDQQATLISDGQPEMLLSLLARRQQLIDDVSTLNLDLDPYRQRWPLILASLDQPQRSRVDGLVGQVQDLLGAIVQQDERDRQSLLAAKGRVAADLQKITVGVAASTAYRTAAYRNSNRFTNKQG